MRVNKVTLRIAMICGLSLSTVALADTVVAGGAIQTPAQSMGRVHPLGLTEPQAIPATPIAEPMTSAVPAVPVMPVPNSATTNSDFATVPTGASVTPPETVNVSNDNKYTVQLSSTDPNMITVRGDQIKDITCPTDACYVKNLQSDPTGAAYISILNNSAFTAFVTTKSNRHFSLWVTPMDEPGKTIVFNPLDGASSVAGTFEKNTDYEDLLINVTRDMEKGSLPDGYGALDLHTMKPFTLPQGLSVQPINALSGLYVAGLHFTVTNTTDSPITLTESEFNHPGIRSVSIQGDMNLPPHGEADLYEIVSNQNQSL